MKCYLLAPGSDPEQSLEKLTREFSELYRDSWERDKKAAHGNKPFSVNIQALFDLWFRGALKIFICKNDAGEQAGYLIGMQFRPLNHNTNVFQVEDWYAMGERPRIKDGIIEALFDYLKTSLDIMGAEELWVSHGEDEVYPVLDGWKDSGGTMIDRYLRE